MAVKYHRKDDGIKLIKDKYHTKLTPSQEKAYKKFLKAHPDFPINTMDYDGAGWFLKYSKTGPDKNMHFDDEFKTPHHRTFSSGSKYVTKGDPGGSWMPIGGQDPNVQGLMGKAGNVYIDPTGKRGLYVEGTDGRPMLNPYEEDLMRNPKFAAQQALRMARKQAARQSTIPVAQAQGLIQPVIAKKESGGYVPRYDLGTGLGVYGTMLGTAGLGVGAMMAADPRFRKKNPYATYGTLGGGGLMGLGSLAYLWRKAGEPERQRLAAERRAAIEGQQDIQRSINQLQPQETLSQFPISASETGELRPLNEIILSPQQQSAFRQQQSAAQPTPQQPAAQQSVAQQSVAQQPVRNPEPSTYHYSDRYTFTDDDLDEFERMMNSQGDHPNLTDREEISRQDALRDVWDRRNMQRINMNRFDMPPTIGANGFVFSHEDLDRYEDQLRRGVNPRTNLTSHYDMRRANALHAASNLRQQQMRRIHSNMAEQTRSQFEQEEAAIERAFRRHEISEATYQARKLQLRMRQADNPQTLKNYTDAWKQAQAAYEAEQADRAKFGETKGNINKFLEGKDLEKYKLKQELEKEKDPVAQLQKRQRIANLQQEIQRIELAGQRLRPAADLFTPGQTPMQVQANIDETFRPANYFRSTDEYSDGLNSSSSSDGFAYGGRVPRYGYGGATLGLLGGLGSFGAGAYVGFKKNPNPLAATLLGLAGLGGLGYGTAKLMEQGTYGKNEYSDVDPALADQLAAHNLNMQQQGLNNLTVAEQQAVLHPKPTMAEMEVQTDPVIAPKPALSTTNPFPVESIAPVIPKKPTLTMNNPFVVSSEVNTEPAERPKLSISKTITAIKDPKLLDSREAVADEMKKKLYGDVDMFNKTLRGDESPAELAEDYQGLLNDIGKDVRSLKKGIYPPLTAADNNPPALKEASGGYVPRYRAGYYWTDASNTLANTIAGLGVLGGGAATAHGIYNFADKKADQKKGAGCC